MTKRPQCMGKLILCGLSINISMVSHCQLSIGHIHFNNTALLHLKEEESTSMYVYTYIQRGFQFNIHWPQEGGKYTHVRTYIHT